MVASLVYRRSASVEFIPSEGPGFYVNPSAAVAERSSNTRDLRVDFDVRRSIAGRANRASISVYNLARSTRERISLINPDALGYEAPFDFVDRRLGLKGRGAQATASAGAVGYIRLQAGYRGRLGTLFEGHIRDALTDEDRVTVVTRFEAGDGSINLGDGVANRTFSDGTPTVEIIKYLVRDVMNLDSAVDLSTTSGALPESLRSAKVRFAATCYGDPRKILDQLARGHRFGWFVDLGEFVILDSTGYLPIPEVVVSQSNGLLGRPQRISDATIRVRSFLRHEIRPGRRVRVNATRYSGVYRADNVQHVGSNKGGPFYTVADLKNLDVTQGLI